VLRALLVLDVVLDQQGLILARDVKELEPEGDALFLQAVLGAPQQGLLVDRPLKRFVVVPA